MKRTIVGDAVVPGKYGHVYEYGSGMLGVCVISESGNAYRWNRARAAFIAAGMEITQNGDHEGCATFDPGNAAQVEKAIGNANENEETRKSQVPRSHTAQSRSC